MAEPTLEDLHAMVRQHPDHYRNAVLEAVERQFGRLYPGLADENPDEADRRMLTIAVGLLNGQDQHQGGDPRFLQHADNYASDFLDMVEHGRQENYPRWDATGEPVATADLSDAQQALNAGNPGPAWNFSEWSKLSPDEQRYKLSPGEYWDAQHGRDIDFLRDMHRAPAIAAENMKTDPQVQAWTGPVHNPQMLMTARGRADALDWYTRSKDAQNSRDGSFQPNYPWASILHHEGYSPEGLMAAVGNTDNPVGGAFSVLDVTSPGIQGSVQGEDSAFHRGLLGTYMDHALNRHSPVIPDTPNDPAQRHSMKDMMEGIRADLRPLGSADSQFLQTGKPQNQLSSIVKDSLLYPSGDIGTVASLGMGAARSIPVAAMKSPMRIRALKTMGGALKNSSGEAAGEVAWALPFAAPPAAQHARGGTLFSPDYGEHGMTKDVIKAPEGDIPFTRPLNAEERAAKLEELRRAQENARIQAQRLFMPGGGYQTAQPLQRSSAGR